MREKKTTKKQKKPFYKRTWFIVLAVFLVIAGIGGANSKKSDGNDPDQVDSQVSQATSSESSSETKNTETIETDTSGFTQDDHVYMMTISQKILDQYLTDYDTPWNDDDWTFAKFDENNVVFVSVDLELKDTSVKQTANCIFEYHGGSFEDVQYKEHFTSVGDAVFFDDGYCDEFFANLSSITGAVNN